ncbi:MAG: LPP20 family lipoprotein [Treponema sp.]|jgi:hypothetical protein|nr:LPP20 family lipoprotein [Treponema sp.]
MLRIFVVIAVVSLASCASSGSAAKSEASPASSSSSSASARPDWVDGTASNYPDSRFVTGVGTGNDRDAADKQALTALISYFSQKVEAEMDSIERASETTVNGRTQTSDSTQVQQHIQVSAAMDNLMGADIKERWSEGRSCYALAVLEKAQAAQLYGDRYASNEEMIAALTDLRPDDRNSLRGYANYKRAETLAAENTVYGSILSLVGSQPPNMKPSRYYRQEADTIMDSIPVLITLDVTVAIPSIDANNATRLKNTMVTRIESAFAAVLEAQGLKTSANASRYELRVTGELYPAEFPDNRRKFIYYAIAAQLTDTITLSKPISFEVSAREGHTTDIQAAEVAIQAAEKAITETCTAKLTEYLASLSK